MYAVGGDHRRRSLGRDLPWAWRPGPARYRRRVPSSGQVTIATGIIDSGDTGGVIRPAGENASCLGPPFLPWAPAGCGIQVFGRRPWVQGRVRLADPAASRCGMRGRRRGHGRRRPRTGTITSPAPSTRWRCSSRRGTARPRSCGGPRNRSTGPPRAGNRPP